MHRRVVSFMPFLTRVGARGSPFLTQEGSETNLVVTQVELCEYLRFIILRGPDGNVRGRVHDRHGERTYPRIVWWQRRGIPRVSVRHMVMVKVCLNARPLVLLKPDIRTRAFRCLERPLAWRTRRVQKEQHSQTTR